MREEVHMREPGSRKSAGMCPRLILFVTALVLTTYIAGCSSSGSSDGKSNALGPTTSAAPRSAPPSPSALPVTGAACLIGTWTVTADTTNPGNLAFAMTGGAQRVTYRADGTGSEVITRAVLTAKLGSFTRTITSTGSGTFTYKVSGEEITYQTANVPGTVVTKDSGKRASTTKTQLINTTPDIFVCNGDTLTFNDPSQHVQFKRAQ
jgi:hypothetical protein